MSKSLISAFEIKIKNNDEEIVNDYDIFPDKDLLEKLRSNIIESIIVVLFFKKAVVSLCGVYKGSRRIPAVSASPESCPHRCTRSCATG